MHGGLEWHEEWLRGSYAVPGRGASRARDLGPDKGGGAGKPTENGGAHLVNDEARANLQRGQNALPRFKGTPGTSATFARSSRKR